MGDVGVAFKDANYEAAVTYHNQYITVPESVSFSYLGPYYC